MTKAKEILGSMTKALSSPFSDISKPTILLWLLILAYILFFSAFSLQRHATFNTFAADLSFIDQPMWNTLHGRFLERTLGDRQVSRVAEHLEPIIIPIAFIFYLWDDVRAILILQTIALALGALPLYWIARELISNLKWQMANGKYEWLPVVFVVVYLMFPALQAANVADFHADPFVVTPLLFAFWYAIQGRYWVMWGWAILAMLVKENLPTLTFMLGLYLLFSGESKSGESGNQESREAGRPISRFPDSPIPRFPASLLARRRLHGVALMAVSLIWFYMATFLIVAPLAREVYGTDGPIYLSSRYTNLGNGSGGLLAQWRGRLTLLREPDRLTYLAGLFASVGWLAVLAPEFLLLGLPVLLANTFSNFPGQYSGEQHYSAPLAPVFVIAAIYGFRRLSVFTARRTRVRWVVRYAPTALIIWLLAWSLGYHYLRGWTPLARDFDWPERTRHHRLLDRFVDQIPPEAPVSTTPPLHPHLAHREKIYVFPTVADADYVLLDVSGRTDAHPNDVRRTFDALIESGEFEIVDAADGYMLLSKQQGVGGQKQALPNAFFDFARVRDAQPQYPALLEFDGRLRFLGYDVIDDPKRQQTYLRLYWQTLAPLSDDPHLWPLIFSESGDLIEDTSQRPMVVPLWYPPSQWQPDEIIITETIPWDLGPRFNVGLAVLQGTPAGSGETDAAASFSDPARRLPITQAGPGVTLFHGNTWGQIGAFTRDRHHLAPTTNGLDLLPLDATFGEGIRLNKYQISNDKSQISIVLEWQPTTAISRNYTTFVHIVAPDGSIVAQSDAQPTWVASWPTSHWQPEQPVLDVHRLHFPPNLPPGGYQVYVGLYYWETLERLPILDETMQPVSDHVVLSEIQIEP
jgi:uncharacterized membrane protein